MSDFTKEELEQLSYLVSSIPMDDVSLLYKIRSMIDNYKEDPWNVKKIAESHLSEASSLISHAMGLLGMEDDNQ